MEKSSSSGLIQAGREIKAEEVELIREVVELFCRVES